MEENLKITNDLGKFDARSDEGIFVGYSTSSKAYRIFNKRTLVVEESVHVAFDETDHVPSKYFPRIDSIDDEMPREISVRNEIRVENAPNSISADAENADGVSSVAAEPANGGSSTAAEQTDELIPIAPQHRDVNTIPREWRYARDQFKEQIIGDPSQGMMTRSSLRNVCNNLAFLSQVEPKSFVEAEKDESWILAMQEELNQFERNQSKYIKDLLKRFDMEKAKPMGTPMSTSTKLDKDEMGKAFDEKKYRVKNSILLPYLLLKLNMSLLEVVVHRDHVQRGDVVIDFVRTDNQLADIFTKPLSEDRFCSIRREIVWLIRQELYFKIILLQRYTEKNFSYASLVSTDALPITNLHASYEVQSDSTS
ncbi:hypothetical protein RHSIM_RhsimUnG0222700 [Rhododendron simsii]|uniref:Retroviral polymerase SH3-like domain-containing protein n=1 Tax=Rhododendron simsii TaxID=118357 RepID=A0A834L3X3_RHOSS|nr:hypothetical protein RHSIM_RhsimUnG0222700 [Rhododendron simsii]